MNITDIKTAINLLLIEETGIKVMPGEVRDIENSKPCFFVKILILKYEKFTYSSDLVLGIHISFFPETKTEFECLKTMDILNEIFVTNNVIIDNNIVEIDDLDAEVKSGFLRYSFKFEINDIEDENYEDYEFMKELEYKGEIK